MTLDQYLEHMKLKLKEFEDTWRTENGKRPDEYPMEFDSEFDWNEQLEAFLG